MSDVHIKHEDVTITLGRRQDGAPIIDIHIEGPDDLPVGEPPATIYLNSRIKVWESKHPGQAPASWGSDKGIRKAP